MTCSPFQGFLLTRILELDPVNTYSTIGLFTALLTPQNRLSVPGARMFEERLECFC